MAWILPMCAGVFLFFLPDGFDTRLTDLRTFPAEGPLRLAALFSCCAVAVWALGAGWLAYYTSVTSIWQDWNWAMRTIVFCLLPMMYFAPRYVVAIWIWVRQGYQQDRMAFDHAEMLAKLEKENKLKQAKEKEDVENTLNRIFGRQSPQRGNRE